MTTKRSGVEFKHRLKSMLLKIILALVWFAVTVNRGGRLLLALYVSAASLVLVPFFQNVTALALLAFTFGLGMGCGQPITMTLTFRNSAKGRSAEVLGLRIAINQGTLVIVPVVFGSAFGLFPVFWIFALKLGSGGVLSRSKTVS